ncbi:hypothetical protein [Mucilaginibacter polytrichastri]|uniref:Uncharacterized protein n=1 Tax=Mucilaginibacter polytrichastri TaxID=1302689 RepID=A0A1Q5ZSY1_9SPHI|nr:hypothetical protein [Mucilaginibacter polytrichastri]OKS84879.1 hypothetical protein RG47T_0316 [Mucilaginibacter polytrichastri]SFS48299.1 hypothetical protein SAMN04487890_101759 [Mucilaginibacter polytrichastri]
MDQNISVDVKVSEEILALLSAIHRYYPIGLPHLNNDYAGYQDVKNIIETKINQLIANDLPEHCTALLNEVKAEFSGLEVYDNLYHQFPSIDLSINLFNSKENNIERVTLLSLKISLLTNHYIIYYENSFTFTNYQTLRHIPIKTRIISSVNEEADVSGEWYKKLFKIVNHIYPLYKQVNHRHVFTRFIKGGLPYPFDYSNQIDYPIYNYLFGNDVINEEVRISN